MPDQERIYIGNVVLDESNQEMLRQWLIDIVDSLQGHGNGFDADTLDGFHATDFATAEQGLKADNALQSGIYIGSTAIENISDTQYILTDGVRIDSTVYGALANAFKGAINEDMILSDFLIALYRNYQKQINDLKETKVDKVPGKDLSTNDFTDDYKGMLDSLSFTELICPRNTDPSQQFIKRALNADSVNHLQFILTTEEIYAQYTDDVKNAWSNVFIFVEPENYPDDYESPLDCPIETGYMFRIFDKGNGELWLQYKGRLARNWLDMVRINDLYNQFVQYGNFESIMNGIATLVATNLINNIDTPEHLNALIKEVNAPSVDDWQDYPFLSSNLDFVYDVVYNGNSLCVKDDNGFFIADVSNITDALEESVNALSSQYNNLTRLVNTNTQKVNTLGQYVKKSDVEGALNSSSSNPIQSSVVANAINSLNGQISTLNNNISNLQQTLSASRRYDKFIIIGRGQYNGSRATGFNTPTDQNQEILGAYELTFPPDNPGHPNEARITVTNRGNVRKASNINEYYYSDPDYIYARVIQEHTGISGTQHANPYIYFQVNGTAYARKIEPGTDYATLNIRLAPKDYTITAMYIDQETLPERPIYATQQILVKDVYPAVK